MTDLLAPSIYLGQVATLCWQPNSSAGSGTATWIMGRSTHYARENIVNPTLIFANFYVPSTNAETTIGAGTIKASIEYPAGTFTLCNEGEISFPNGLTALTFTNVVIPYGAKFWVRALQKNSNGVIWINNGTGTAASGCGFEFGTGAATDKTATGTVAASTNSYYGPIAILAPTRRPSVLMHGDSRNSQGLDIVSDNSYDYGEALRSIGPSFGYTSLSTSGASLSGYKNSHTYRQQLAQYYSHIWNAYGVNDMNGAGASAAQLAADQVIFNAYSEFTGKTIIGQTLTPFTTSTDSFATTTNQTIQISDKIRTYNDLVRAGITGQTFYFDVSDAVDPLRSGKWPVERSLVGSSGSAGFSTTDGLHGNKTIHALIRDRGGINLNWIRR